MYKNARSQLAKIASGYADAAYCALQAAEKETERAKKLGEMNEDIVRQLREMLGTDDVVQVSKALLADKISLEEKLAELKK